MGAMFIMAMGTYPDRFFSVQTIDQAGTVIAQALHGRWMAGPNAFDSSETWIMVGTNPVVSKQGLYQPGSDREAGREERVEADCSRSAKDRNCQTKDRKSIVEGKIVSIREDIGGR